MKQYSQYCRLISFWDSKKYDGPPLIDLFTYNLDARPVPALHVVPALSGCLETIWGACQFCVLLHVCEATLAMY